MPMSEKSYVAVRLIPTTIGRTAIIPDPGPLYPVRARPEPGLELGLQAQFIEWPFPETSRARTRRMVGLLLGAAVALTSAYRRVGEEAARTAEALRRSNYFRYDEERQEPV